MPPDDTCCHGPGYKSPMDAYKNGPREKLLYTVCVRNNLQENKKPDYLATVDVDPDSPTYSQVIPVFHALMGGRGNVNHLCEVKHASLRLIDGESGGKRHIRPINNCTSGLLGCHSTDGRLLLLVSTEMFHFWVHFVPASPIGLLPK